MKFKLNRLLFFIFVLLFVEPSVFAQKGPAKFGKVSKEELKMTVYEKDTVAEAVVLFSKGVSEIKYMGDKGFVLVFTNHTRIKILKKEGLEYADIEIPLHLGRNSADEKVIGLKAQSYNLENDKIIVTKLSKKDVFEEDVSTYMKLKKFAIPNVKVGSVIEYKYTVSSDFFYIKPWYFQSEIPVEWSEYSVVIPEYFEFKYLFSYYITPTSKESDYKTATFPGGATYQVTVERYVYKNLPAFRNEEYITTANDYLAKVEFEHLSTKIPGKGVETYTSTWKEICHKIMARDDFGAALNRSGIVKELTQIVEQAADQQQKITLAYELMRKKMRWNGEYGIFAQTTLRSAYNKEEGNVAEINLLLINLLRSVGLDAYPVLLSTRANGKINKTYPNISGFNYVVAFVKLGDKHLFLDASDDYIALGELPFQCMSGEGMVIMDSKPVWMKLRNKEMLKKGISVMMSMDDEGVEADIRRSSYSLNARNLRIKILKVGQEKYIEDYINKQEEWDIENYTIENVKELAKPVLEKLKISHFNNIDTDVDIIYLPAIIVDDEISNPFTDEERKYPVDFGVPISIQYLLNFKVPEDFSVEAPANSTVILPGKAAVFVYKTHVQNNVMQIICQININRTLFMPNEYSLLKEFYSHITEKLNEQIVLKRM